MPHCIIEYSESIKTEIDMDSLLDTVLGAVSETGLFERSSIKVRAIGYEFYKSGMSGQSFIHVCIKILSGRSEQQKETLSNAVLSELSKVGEEIRSITIDVVDMEAACYSKREIQL